MITILLTLLLALPCCQAYNETAATEALMFSYAAYAPVSQLTSWSCTWCKRGSSVTNVQVVTPAHTETQAYIGLSHNRIIVVFRGTANFDNWVHNVNYVATPLWPGSGSPIEVHRGFLEDYNALRPGVFAAVTKMKSQYPKYSLLISGHSLGGALASLALVDFVHTQGFKADEITFGSPRVGNNDFFQFHQKNALSSFRVVNQHDLVPHVPLEEMPPWETFRHVATEIWYTSFTQYTICDQSGEDPKCSDSVGIIHTSICDHLHYLGLELHPC